MADAPKLTPETAEQITDALRNGDAIVCYAKCWPCQFGQCTDEPHAWMDDDDITHAGLTVPTTPRVGPRWPRTSRAAASAWRRPAVADVITLPRPTRTDGDSELDLPPCGNAWQPLCPHGGPHACWTWRGWPHVCRCRRCHTWPVAS